MTFPLFFEIPPRGDKVRVEYKAPDLFEIHVQFAVSGLVDLFVYKYPCTEEEKTEVVRGNLSRMLIVDEFEKLMTNSEAAV
jgi:hypothetical protein